MDIRKESLHFSLHSFFLYLANATICIDEEAKYKVWNDMAYKLIEWNDTPRDELRAVFREFGAQFEELCYSCNEPLPIIDEEYKGNARCFECMRVSEPEEHEEHEHKVEAYESVTSPYEAEALDTYMEQFHEVEAIMDKSYDGLYGYPSDAFLKNFGTIQAFRRTSRSSHPLFGEYRKKKIQAYEAEKIEKE